MNPHYPHPDVLRASSGRTHDDDTLRTSECEAKTQRRAMKPWSRSWEAPHVLASVITVDLACATASCKRPSKISKFSQLNYYSLNRS